MSQQETTVNLWCILDKKDRGGPVSFLPSFSPLSFMCMAIFSLTLAHSLP
jgi:hypothetical protein